MDNQIILYDFTDHDENTPWYVVDDGVMGGRSQGQFQANQEVGKFEGTVSLENNGGFSSIRCAINRSVPKEMKSFFLRLKGDRKNYQFRVKQNRSDYHSFTFSFATSGEWQTIIIPFTEMEPAFRGRKLRMDNYLGEEIFEIGILIGNKVEEKFALQIERIGMM